MIIPALLAAALAAAPAASDAAPPPAAATAASTNAADAGSDGQDELICRYEARTNTRFAKKICHTKAEWAAMTEVSRRAADDLLNRPGINRPDNN